MYYSRKIKYTDQAIVRRDNYPHVFLFNVPLSLARIRLINHSHGGYLIRGILFHRNETSVKAVNCLSQHVSVVNYPSLTFCNPTNLDTGEYVRAVFNNIEFDDKELTKYFPIQFTHDIFKNWAM